MGLVLILAEKPSQGKAYAEAFKNSNRKDGYIEVSDNRLFDGQKAFITWGFGHLIEMVKPEDYKEEWKRWNLDTLPILPEKYKFQVASNRGVKKQYNVVKRLLNEATKIVVASDADREGENIARSIIEQAGATGILIKRLWINSLEVNEIVKGFQNLKDGKEYESFYKEAQTRQISDWLVGMNGSRLYTLLLQGAGQQGVFSVGRVQSPSLYQVYKRQQEIKDFISKPFYEIVGNVVVSEGDFEAKYNNKYNSKQELHSFLNKCSVGTGNNDGVIKSVEKLAKKTSSPRLHSLSTLQTKANKRWKYSPSDTLTIVQELYEKKLLSYPRTDTQFITDSEFGYLKENLTKYKSYADLSFDVTYPDARKRYVNGAKVQEHYAIIPTRQIPKKSNLSQKEKNIYDEVMLTTLAMFADDYHYEETKVDVDVNGVVLHAKGNVAKVQGWKSLFISSDQKEGGTVLPAMGESESCNVDVSIKEGKTKPPKPYTEGDLINMMKNAGRDMEDEESKDILKKVEGIGTEATRASIIETLKNQQYIEIKRNIVTVTTKGETLCKVIGDSLLASPKMTAKWEQYLAKIGRNEGTQEKFLDSIQRFVLAMIEDAPSSIEKNKEILQSNAKLDNVGDCSSCNDGVISDRGKFYGCSNHSNGCKFTLPKKWAGKMIPKKDIVKLLTDNKTGIIKGFKKKKGGTFDAYLVLKDGNISMDFAKRK